MRYDRLERCRICPRLAAHLDQVRETHPGYRCLPVGAAGSARAKLLLVAAVEVNVPRYIYAARVFLPAVFSLVSYQEIKRIAHGLGSNPGSTL